MTMVKRPSIQSLMGQNVLNFDMSTTHHPAWYISTVIMVIYNISFSHLLIYIFQHVRRPHIILNVNTRKYIKTTLLSGYAIIYEEIYTT